MSRFRCFNAPKELALTQTSSDRTNNIRNKTIYSGITNHNNNKKDGYNYNSGVNLNFSTDCSCLLSAPSHTDLLQVTKGAYLNNPISTESPYSKCKYDPKDGIFMVTTYATNIVGPDFSNSTPNTIHPGPFCDICPDACGNYPGVVIDPSFTVFYKDCNDEVNFMKNVAIDDMESNRDEPSQIFTQYASYDKLHGFVYPRKLNFICPPSNDE
jgi:hypothetical protein